MEDKQEISRRKFILGGLGLGAAQVGGIILGAKAAHELSRPAGTDSIFTDSTEYVLMYEQHTDPPKAEHIQRLGHVDSLFMEVITDQKHFSEREVGELLSINGIQGHYLLEQDSLDFLHQQQSILAYEGTVYTEDMIIKNHILGSTILPLLAMSPAMKSRIDKTVDKAMGRERTETRRSFIRKLGTATFGVWAFSGLGTTGVQIGTPGSKDPNYLKFHQILDNVAGAVENLHPEDVLTFYRNLEMAMKMEVVSNYLREKNQLQDEDKPRIAFKVGKGHSGLPAFLSATHQDKVDWVKRYPDFFLNDLVNANGGVTKYCSTVILEPVDPNASPSGEKWKKLVLVDGMLQAELHSRLNRND